MPLTILRCPPDPRLDLLQLKLELALLFCEGISSCGELLGMLFFHGVDYLLCLLHRFPECPVQLIHLLVERTHRRVKLDDGRVKPLYLLLHVPHGLPPVRYSDVIEIHGINCPLKRCLVSVRCHLLLHL